MGREVCAREAVFRRELDQAAELLGAPLGLDLRQALFADPGEEPAARLRQTALAQPALFAVEYALAQLWMSWGVRPRAMLGHSLGEYVAACLAGVFALPDALALVAERGRLMQELPPGAMLGVALSAEELAQELPPELAVAAVNAPDLTVASGPPAAVAALAASLAAQGVEAKPLHTSHAFHSSMIEPI